MTNIQTEAPITISLDVAELVRHLRGTYGAYRGGDDMEEPESAIDPLVSVAVDRLVTDLRKEIASEVAAAAKAEIAGQVRQIVADTLAAEYEASDEFGRSRGRTSLREQIAKEISAWADKRTSTDYNRSETQMTKFIRENVAREMAADLKAVVEENREVLKSHMRNVAAALLAAEAARR